ncbi:hypothetical protein BD626DRAFT_361460, partial [Schizophyllum amplum]
FSQALDWTHEALVVVHNLRWKSPVPLHGWKDFHLAVPELVVQFCVSCELMSQIFLYIGNTGSAMSVLSKGIRETISIPGDWRRRRDFKDATDMRKQVDIGQLRHPDPKSRPTHISDPRLQVWGSWTRLHAKRPVKKELMERQGHTCFIWKSRLYLAGGRNGTFTFFRDLWYLDLEADDLAWRKLPDYPVPVEETNMFWNWTMVVHDNKAYVVNGRRNVDYFDLITEKWERLQCTYEPLSRNERNWPY